MAPTSALKRQDGFLILRIVPLAVPATDQAASKVNIIPNFAPSPDYGIRLPGARDFRRQRAESTA